MKFLKNNFIWRLFRWLYKLTTVLFSEQTFFVIWLRRNVICVKIISTALPTHLQFLFTWGLLVFLSGDEEDNHLFIWWVSFSTFFSILFWHDVCAWEQKSFLMSPSMGIVCIFRRLRCNDASIYSEKESDTKKSYIDIYL